jgi:hypothetical protein
VDGGSSINVTFPWTLQGLGVTLKELHESDTPFFSIVPTKGEYPLGHIYMLVTFGTSENYITGFLRFEVANFDCGYNTFGVSRPGVPGPTSEMSPRAPAQMGRREAEREGGKRRPETGVREVEISRPSCSSRAQVGCACSRGLQASTRERERAASRERLSRPRPRAANPL